MAVDVVMDILKAMLLAKPEAVFVQSLYEQYCNRGGLSRKQLEGLHSKASKVAAISLAKLATLEAIIKKKPIRNRGGGDLPAKTETVSIDPAIAKVQEILVLYPLHKRLLYFSQKLQQKQPLTLLEREEIERFAKLLLPK